MDAIGATKGIRAAGITNLAASALLDSTFIVMRATLRGAKALATASSANTRKITCCMVSLLPVFVYVVDMYVLALLLYSCQGAKRFLKRELKCTRIFSTLLLAPVYLFSSVLVALLSSYLSLYLLL